jgi:MEMO1 family protein
MKKIILGVFIFLCLNPLFSQNKNNKIRQMIDTIGFASKPGQMDEFIKRAYNTLRDYQYCLQNTPGVESPLHWKVAISPHDDYTYVGYLYPCLLSNISVKTIILLGVCHKAKLFNLENKIIFDTYSNWKMPYGNVRVSRIREEIISGLPLDSYIIHDSIQALEHSVEAIIPFLQYYNRGVEIVSILIPYMSYDKMDEIAEPLAGAIKTAVEKNRMEWGRDFAIVISSDAVHYGDEDWGGKNFALYGTDSIGYSKAVEHEYEIINSSLVGNIQKEKIKKFIGYTVDEKNFKEYKWTWCGRYSVPFGLLTSFYLQKLFNLELTGSLVGYATSLDYPPVPVTDIGMGITAPANIHHWVGYAAIGYK